MCRYIYIYVILACVDCDGYYDLRDMSICYIDAVLVDIDCDV